MKYIAKVCRTRCRILRNKEGGVTRFQLIDCQLFYIVFLCIIPFTCPDCDILLPAVSNITSLVTRHQSWKWTSSTFSRAEVNLWCPRRVNVFEIRVTLPGGSEVSLSATTPCRLQLCTLSRSLASNLYSYCCNSLWIFFRELPCTYLSIVPHSFVFVFFTRKTPLWKL
jgi:hypothetical protein